MGCLNSKFLTNRPSQSSSHRNNNGHLCTRSDSSPDEDKLLKEYNIGNGTSKSKLESNGSKKSKCKQNLVCSTGSKGKMDSEAPPSSPPITSASTKSTSNGGGLSLFGRRLGLVNSSRNADGLAKCHQETGNEHNGSILYSLGTLLENGARSTSSSNNPARSLATSTNDNPDEATFESPLTPDRLHKNFQERLLTSQVSRNNQKLTDSQLEFFRMLDEKIAQGREDDVLSANA